jgi:hypothetical protein
MQYKFSIRKHLGKGQYFGFWQVRTALTESQQGEIVGYIDPSKFGLKCHNTKLYIRANLSAKIFLGTQKKKKPCAWILCESYEVTLVNKAEYCDSIQISFNPRLHPDWLLAGENVNRNSFKVLQTKNSKVYAV